MVSIPDTVEYRAVKLSTETGSVKTEWEKYFHFFGENQQFRIKTDNLNFDRYRVRFKLDEVGTFFQEFDIVFKRSVEWGLSDDFFLNPDSISFSLKNLSGSRFFIPKQGEFVRLGFSAVGIKDGMKLQLQDLGDTPYHTGFHFDR